MEQEKTFIEIHKESIEYEGFWDEITKSLLIIQMEKMYKTHIIKEYFISDICLHEGKVLFKWKKRTFPISEEDLLKRYDRKI